MPFLIVKVRGIVGVYIQIRPCKEAEVKELKGGPLRLIWPFLLLSCTRVYYAVLLRYLDYLLAWLGFFC
jgi:hypothetical protein